ncbi:MAG TPA: hypothetical protein VF937_14220 [Chloroflexota bacterium]
MTLGELLVMAPARAAVAETLSGLEVRTQFAQCGYEVGNPGSPPSNQFIVLRDPGADLVNNADYRIAMAIVYRDESAAVAAHRQAHSRAEQRLGGHWAWSDDNGPQLLAGYGGSVWRGNVAMVESTSRTLDSMYTYDVQANQTRVARPDLLELGFVSKHAEYAVDRDFVVCLEGLAPLTASQPDSTTTTATTANTPAADTGLVEPIFMPGQPW